MKSIERMAISLAAGLLLSALLILPLGTAPTEQKILGAEPETLETFPAATKSEKAQTKETVPAAVPSVPVTTEPPATEHVHSYTAQTVNPACTADGYTVYTCTCGHSYRDHTVTATGHSWSEWSVIAAVTCEADGTKIRTCHCGDAQEECIPALGHDYVCQSVMASTTAAEGWECYVCTQCGNAYTVTLPTLSAVEGDMCGESLLGKALPNAPYPEFSKLVMERWSEEITYQESKATDKLPHPGTLSSPYKVIEEWEIPYAYITQEFSSTTTIISCLGMRTLAFHCWAEEAEYEEMRTIYSRVYEILAELDIDETVTKKEAITRINDWICQQKYYNYDFINDRSLRDDSLYYSVFADNGICQNYALAFQVICLGAGIECHYYEAKGMAHAWNKVYFSDGTFLWVDVCWNDAGDYNRYYNPYLLITTEQLLRDHKL